MQGRRELHAAEREVVAAPDVHRVCARHPLPLLRVAHDLEGRDQRRSRPLEYPPRVRHVVEVAMGEQEVIQPIEVVGADVGKRVVRKERIDKEPRSVLRDQLDAGVPVKDQSRHSSLASGHL